MAADDGVPCYRSLYPAEKIGRVWQKIGIVALRQKIGRVAAEDWKIGGRRLVKDWQRAVEDWQSVAEDWQSGER